MKSVDELKIDVDILIIEIGDLKSKDDQSNVLKHLEESLKVLKTKNDGVTERGEDEPAEPRRKRPRLDTVHDEEIDREDTPAGSAEDDPNDNDNSEEFELNNTFHSDDVMAVPDLTKIKKEKSQYYVQKRDGLYNCIFCDFETDKLVKMKIHMSRHTSNIKCDLCDVYFARAVNLKRHKEGVQHKARMMAAQDLGFAAKVGTEEEDECPRYVCTNAPDCDLTFSSEAELNNHIETHLYQCQLCQAFFSNDEDRFEHLRSDHDVGGDNESKRSGAETENDEVDPPGLIVNVGQEYVCKQCGKSYSRKDSYKKHLILHTDRFKCHRCEKTFTERKKLENHINNNEECASEVNYVDETEKQDQTYSCEICFKSYHKKEYLNQHMNEHTDRFKCSSCSSTFSTKRRLDTHTRSPGNCSKLLQIRENAKRRTEDMFLGSSSNRRKSESDASTIKQERSLLSTPSNKSSKIKIECQLCQVQVANLYNLRRHMERCHQVSASATSIDHDTPPPSINQETPDNESGTSSTLETHDDTPTEIEVFHCEDCDKFFSSRASLTSHAVSHTDKFRCSNCNLGFSSRRDLEQHSKNRENCEKLLMKKQRESMMNSLDAGNFVETIIYEEESTDTVNIVLK